MKSSSVPNPRRDARYIRSRWYRHFSLACIPLFPFPAPSESGAVVSHRAHPQSPLGYIPLSIKPMRPYARHFRRETRTYIYPYLLLPMIAMLSSHIYIFHIVIDSHSVVPISYTYMYTETNLERSRCKGQHNTASRGSDHWVLDGKEDKAKVCGWLVLYLHILRKYLRLSVLVSYSIHGID